MDPSGIIGIIGVAAHILHTCTKLGMSWHDAPKDAKDFHSELVSLHKALSDIQDRIIRDPDFIAAFEGKHSSLRSMLTAPGSSNGSNPLLDCQTELKRVLKELQKRLDGHRFGWERLRAAFSGEKTQSAIANLQRRCQDIINMILVDNTTLVVNTNLEVRSTRKYLEERHLDENKKQILNWITPIDFAKQLIDNLDRRQEGTGQWLLESPEFQTWIEEDRATLFCPGMPGAGKTMLSSIVIEYLQQEFDEDPTVGIAYLFCNFRRHDEQKPRELLASILKQLYRDMPAGPGEVEKAYEKHHFGSSSMSKQEIVGCLHSVTSCFTKVYVLVDALDECRGDEGYRDTILKTILGLNETANVNCFATSRHIPEIESYFDEAPSIEIRATDEDVMEFLNGHMYKLPQAVKKNKELQAEIKHNIVRAVQGMFLLAQLHLDSLQGKRSAKTIKDALEKLATGSSAYDNAYDEAMERIEGQLDDQETLAKDALSWIVCARRPLRTVELQHALAVEEGMTEIDEYSIPELEDIVSVCAGLVTIDEESEVIRLVHYTTQEYFERTTKRWFPNAEQLIIDSCISYLSLDAFSASSYDYQEGLKRWEAARIEKELMRRLEKYTLYKYAALEWGNHARNISPHTEGLVSFLTGSRFRLRAAFRASWVYQQGEDDASPAGVSGLHLAAFFGLKEIFSIILEQSETEAGVNAKDSYDFTPLCYAVMGCKADFIAWLLSIDEVEVNSQTRYYKMSPIGIAIGTESVANVLPFIESEKVDLEFEDGEGLTPLSIAAGTGNLEIVRALVESDMVDIEAQNRYGRTPLWEAVFGGKPEVVRYLLGTGKANANIVHKDGVTPLQIALNARDEETARCLLDSGQVDASLSIKGLWGCTPLDDALEQFGRDHSITGLILDRMKAIGISTEARMHAWEVAQQFPYASLFDLSDIDSDDG